MPINFKLDDDAGCAHDIVKRWVINGHEVAVIKHGRLDDPDNRRIGTLVCECDYDVVMAPDGGSYSLRNDPDACLAKSGARAKLKMCSAISLRVTLSLHGLEEAILDVHRRIEEGECFGQAQPGMIYVQEVAELLGKQTAEVHAAVRKLFAQEKLDLNGMILIPFVPRFRFPEEMRMMIRMMVEAPIGWPNGDAGGCAIETLEAAITKSTDYKNGKDLVWEHNYPHIAPHHLLEFGMHFIAIAIGRGEKEDAAREDLCYTDCEHVAKWLEATAAQVRAFGTANGFPKSFSFGAAVDATNASTPEENGDDVDQPQPDADEEEEENE